EDALRQRARQGPAGIDEPRGGHERDHGRGMTIRPTMPLLLSSLFSRSSMSRRILHGRGPVSLLINTLPLACHRRPIRAYAGLEVLTQAGLPTGQGKQEGACRGFEPGAIWPIWFPF